ncbi:MAG: hypothetical protein A2176_07665 [Spirochaetes bacterium RBG_13_51_14]|nr:MAG: hypothetical protein A2176_07665 [Spirochaetes bacterium RBG_13_51_14]
MKPSDNETRKILIVEDSLVITMELQEKLTAAGYAVADAVVSGEEAIEAMRKMKPDLVLMDIMLAGKMNGIEASIEIKKVSDIPIIYTTAYSDEDTIRRLKLTDPYAFLKKPYDDKELIIAIEIALNRHHYQAKVKKSELKYRKLFEDSRDAIFIVGADGIIVDFNRAFASLTGFDNGEKRTLRVHDLFPVTADLEMIERDIDGPGYIKDHETVINGGNNTLIPCLITANKLEQVHSNSGRYQGIIRDISDLKRNIEKQNNLIQGIIQAMARTVEARDPYTAGHQARVARIAEAIARQLGLPENKIREIEMAAMIHDLGKIYVPSEILSKPGKINETEFAIIKAHPEIAYEILKEIEFPFSLAEIVYQHHERVDGSGYPRRLKGEEILLEAKIISVADVVEAMASHRPYRPTLGITAAVEEVSLHQGEYYDAGIVEALKAIYATGILSRIILMEAVGG